MKEITFDILKEWNKKFDSNEANIIAMNATYKNGIHNASTNYEEVRNARHSFSTTIKTGDITNQKQSGRCWMFASLNFMRLEVMKKLNLKTMELSQNYPLFFDKLEKSNYFLENIIDTVTEPLNGRVVTYLLKDPMGDGGQWDMFASLVNKYGVVPKEAMPESTASSSTHELDRYLTLKLREYAKEIRNDYENGKSIEDLKNKKKTYLGTIYNMLCIALGKPPVKFTYEGYDKDEKFFRIEDITPTEFYNKYVGLNLDDYISVINAPTKDKPFDKSYTVKYLGNVLGGRKVKYLNLPIVELKKLAISQMKDNQAVWFGSDVGQYSTKVDGLMSLDAYDTDKLFGTSFNMTKAERLDYGESLMTHAMLLTGVNLEDDIPNRWRVENSWGKDAGHDGYYVMTDDWFDEYTYQVVINKKYLSKDQLAEFEETPIELEPWDPMGSLATVK